MMPSNAQVLFEVLIKIATVDIFPSEYFINQLEYMAGLVNDNVSLTENFEVYGYDSTGPMRNLQIMFIGIVLLVVFPLFAFLLKVIGYLTEICCCDNSHRSCIRKLKSKMYWNFYIRFWLEAYLELSISGFIRLKYFNFDSASENFHSIFSVIILICLLTFFMFFAIYL